MFDINCLRRALGDRDIRKMCGNRRIAVERENQNILKWLGHMKRMDERRFNKIIYKGGMFEARGRG